MTKNRIGSVGVAFGLLALGITLFHFWAGPFTQKEPSLLDSITEKSKSLKESFKAKISGEETTTMTSTTLNFDVDRAMLVTSIATAFLAIVFGVISFLKREDTRYSVTAVVIGGSALAFHFILVLVGLAILLIVFVTLFNN